MSATLMRVDYAIKGVPQFYRDFLEKLSDRFCLEGKDNHFWIENLEDLNEWFNEYVKTLKAESDPHNDELNVEEATDCYNRLVAYLKRFKEEGWEFAVGW